MRGGCGERREGEEAAKRRGKGANFIPTAANRGGSFLLGHSGVSVPFDQFLLPRPACPLLPAPAPSLASPPRPPRLPAPLSAQLLCAPLGRRRARRRKTQGTETRDKNVLEEKAKSSAQLGEKVFLVAARFVPAQTPACGEGFLPLPLVWAAGLGLERKEAVAPAGERTVTSVGDTQPTQVTLPWRLRNAGYRLSAHTPAAEGHFLNAGKTHSPAARMGRGWGGA